MLLLLVTAVVSAFLGERAGAAIIGAILAISVGLGFLNEYRAERAVEALHEEIRHDAPAIRDGSWSDVDVTELVPGDVVRLELGMIVPADLRILEATNLECDESVLTGEAEAVEKFPAPVAAGLAVADLSGRPEVR
jgi:Mg2+-importing ATPase